MPKWFDKFMEDATSPLEGGDENQTGEHGIIRRTIEEAVDGFKVDAQLPIGLTVGVDKDGKPTIVKTGRGDGKPGHIRKAINGLLIDASLPIGYAMGHDEDGNEIIVQTGNSDNGSIMKTIGESVRAEITPDIVGGATGAMAGLFRDLNSGLDLPDITVEEFEARQERKQQRIEAAKNVARVTGQGIGFVAGRAWQGAKFVGGEAGKLAAVGKEFVARKVARRQAAARQNATVIDEKENS